MSLDARLERLERAYIRSLVQAEADAYGLDVDELFDERQRFMALTDAEQDGELAAEIAQAEAHGDLAFR